MKAEAAAWWLGEEPVRLGDLPRLLPLRANGKRVSLASVYRWTTAGLRGVRLRTFRHAGGLATTREELARWQLAQTEAVA